MIITSRGGRRVCWKRGGGGGQEERIGEERAGGERRREKGRGKEASAAKAGGRAGKAKRIDMMSPVGDGECKAPYCEVGTSFFALLTGWVKRQTLFNKFRNRPVLLISVA